MILCLDSGNTRIKWGVHDGRQWLAQGALAHAEVATLSALLQRWPGLQGGVMANVAGEQAGERIRTALAGVHIVDVKSSAAACGVRSAYLFPEKLGVDRWCALIGARQVTPGAVLVVMAGTATTVDSLDAAGCFLGGLILPGVQLMRESLGRGTAALPIAQGEYRPFPRCTEDAIQSGIVEAQAGAIERAYARLEGEQKICLLAGGNAKVLAEALQIPCRLVDNLPLEGLQEIAKAG